MKIWVVGAIGNFPEYQTFLNANNSADFWFFVQWFLFLVSPFVMIYAAAKYLPSLFKTIRAAFVMGDRGIDKETKSKDDDDYEVRYYR